MVGRTPHPQYSLMALLGYIFLDFERIHLKNKVFYIAQTSFEGFKKQSFLNSL